VAVVVGNSCEKLAVMNNHNRQYLQCGLTTVIQTQLCRRLDVHDSGGHGHSHYRNYDGYVGELHVDMYFAFYRVGACYKSKTPMHWLRRPDRQ